MWWFDLIIKTGLGLARIIALGSHKTRLWFVGRNNWAEKMQQKIYPTDRVIWFHAASLGEFEEGRPIIEAIRNNYPQFKILLTFFSPSGYEIRKNYDQVDWVFYLPADTQANMKKFLEIVHPDMTFFIKYEFWPNLLFEMQKRSLRTYVISARFIPNSRFFAWYGGIFRKSLQAFENIFVQDDRSVELLNRIGIKQVVRAGDPRFDRVAAIAETNWHNPIIEAFKQDKRVLIAGSTCGAGDENLLQALINRHPDSKFIIVPHEMNSQSMEKLEQNTKMQVLRYTKCNSQTNFNHCQVLIIDTIGMLAMIYRYGTFAFIGGGFVAGIHSVIEASVYGLPAAFGPNYKKNRPGIDLMKRGACRSVVNITELDTWFTALKTNEATLKIAADAAYQYCQEQRGATEMIIGETVEKNR